MPSEKPFSGRMFPAPPDWGTAQWQRVQAIFLLQDSQSLWWGLSRPGCRGQPFPVSAATGSWGVSLAGSSTEEGYVCAMRREALTRRCLSPVPLP